MDRSKTSSSGRRHLRQQINEMVHNIEAVMVNINSVLGEVTVLVKEIDSITERLETHYENKIKKREVVLDANRNHCDVLDTPGFSNQSKLTTPSPYLDYTYLDLANDCDTCHENVHSFTFNEKYPLWIQYNTWKHDNSISDVSEVSAGSDSNNLASGESYDKSWKSVSNLGRKTECVHKNYYPAKSKSKFEEEDIAKFTKCCSNSHTDLSEKYCGVYEQIMEQQLEALEQSSIDFIETNQFSDTVSSGCTSEDCCNEALGNSGYFSTYTINYSQQDKPACITVREFSDSNTSVSE
ncbi:uncharacterized protein LOC132746687 [Ruditapes philippinarum]|uniref:uncharacterized protein LOC132746687 n=1 Tax=Ruditapes philippinarum TaxID=129788 RepID=UPI00295C0562|nr:uncharacterized protein LOC132746687 [Ruditapes philippinarum]XP_060591890.1 uncharacterized protein LOC132746687 [Ruditapes philippinarum]XP_060591891.1 uncharacterized protein LOC132746687 [Ruditapes philippinarum]